MRDHRIACIDIGGTTIRVVIFENPTNPKIIDRDRFKHSRNKDVEGDVAALVRMISELSNDELEGIGVSIAGVPDEKVGGIVDSGNLSGWHGFDLRHALQELGHQAEIRNDAASAAEGEARYGAGGLSGQPFRFIISGGGLGGAIVLPDGKGGFDVQPQEPGHIVINFDSDLVCGCTRVGCLEAHVGGTCMERRYNVATCADMTEAQWSTYEAEMGVGMGSLDNDFHVEAVYFGGGVILNQVHRLPKINLIAGKRTLQPVPMFLPATHGHDSGLHGVLSLFIS